MKLDKTEFDIRKEKFKIYRCLWLKNHTFKVISVASDEIFTCTEEVVSQSSLICFLCMVQHVYTNQTENAPTRLRILIRLSSISSFELPVKWHQIYGPAKARRIWCDNPQKKWFGMKIGRFLHVHPASFGLIVWSLNRIVYAQVDHRQYPTFQ